MPGQSLPYTHLWKWRQKERKHKLRMNAEGSDTRSILFRKQTRQNKWSGWAHTPEVVSPLFSVLWTEIGKDVTALRYPSAWHFRSELSDVRGFGNHWVKYYMSLGDETLLKAGCLSSGISPPVPSACRESVPILQDEERVHLPLSTPPHCSKQQGNVWSFSAVFWATAFVRQDGWSRLRSSGQCLWTRSDHTGILQHSPKHETAVLQEENVWFLEPDESPVSCKQQPLGILGLWLCLVPASPYLLEIVRIIITV